MPNKLEITHAPPGYTVRFGRWWDEGLTAGEALEVAAKFLMCGENAEIPYLVSDEVHSLRNKRRMTAEPDKPRKLEWDWVSAGRWEAASIKTPGYVYVILLDRGRFYFSRHAYGDAVTFAAWYPTMPEAQNWCDRTEGTVDIPF